MGFTTNDGMVRVDRFKPGGKWYDTWEVNMSKVYRADAGRSVITGDVLPPTWLAVEEAILAEIARHGDSPDEKERLERAKRTFQQWTWVCLEPYHYQAYPIMFVASSLPRVTLSKGA